MVRTRRNHSNGMLQKTPSGITGLDEITAGGLPRGRPTLVCGGAGCGKTLFGIEFLVRGARQFHEPGVFVSFEETTDELAQNVASFGYDLRELAAHQLIALDHVAINPNEIEEAGEYDLEALFNGTNEYPFLISEQGISVLPVTSLGLNHEASTERLSTGVESLDAMLEGKGYYRGSSIRMSGTAGTGKSSFAAQMAQAACRRGERCLYFAFEESQSQIIRDMRSIGTNLEPWVKKGLLHFHALRPVELHGERKRVIYVLKARGMAPSNQLREFVLTNQGIALRDPYTAAAASGEEASVTVVGATRVPAPQTRASA